MISVTEQVRKLEEELNGFRKSSVSMKSTLQSTTNQNKVLQREINFFKAKVRALEGRPIQKEVVELRERLIKEAEKPTVRRANQRVNELQKQMYELTNKTAPIKDVQSKLTAACKEIEKLRASLSDKDIHIDVQQKEIDNLLTKIQEQG